MYTSSVELSGSETTEHLGRCGLLLQLVRQRVNLEAVETGYKLIGGTLGAQLRVHHEEHVGKARAEVGAVGVMEAT